MSVVIFGVFVLLIFVLLPNNSKNKKDVFFKGFEKVAFPYMQFFMVHEEDREYSLDLHSLILENMSINQYIEISNVPVDFEIKNNLTDQITDYGDFRLVVKKGNIFILKLSEFKGSNNFNINFNNFVNIK